MKHPSYILLISCLLLVACNRPDNAGNPICVNQLGFAPHQEKTATIDVHSFDEPPCKAFILNTTGDTVWSGIASPTMPNPVSGKPRQIVDFSSLTTGGEYTLCVLNSQNSQILHTASADRSRPCRDKNSQLKLIPCGLAIQNARATKLGDSLCRDGYHLNYVYGRYTAACVWYEIITGRDVRRNHYRNPHMTRSQQRLTQRSAHKANKKFE